MLESLFIESGIILFLIWIFIALFIIFSNVPHASEFESIEKMHNDIDNVVEEFKNHKNYINGDTKTCSKRFEARFR